MTIEPAVIKVGGKRSSAGTPHNALARSSRDHKEEIDVMNSSTSCQYSKEEEDSWYMEKYKSDSIVTFMSRQVRLCGNMMLQKNEAHLPFSQKKDFYHVLSK